MNAVIEQLNKLATQRITKGKLDALREAYDDANTFLEHLYPKSTDPDAAAKFEHASSVLQDALGDLDSAISELEDAEDKGGREDAISSIEDALARVISGFGEIMPFAIEGTTPRPAAATSPASDRDRLYKAVAKQCGISVEEVHRRLNTLDKLHPGAKGQREEADSQ